MKTIYKYIVKYGDVMLPKEAIVVKSKVERGEDGLITTLWCFVESENELEKRVFDIYGTGWDLSDQHTIYMGTHFVEYYVWHLFEILSK